jgi:hypothetical protein
MLIRIKFIFNRLNYWLIKLFVKSKLYKLYIYFLIKNYGNLKDKIFGENNKSIIFFEENEKGKFTEINKIVEKYNLQCLFLM